MENKQEKSQEDMLKEAVEEAKKSAAEAKEAETDTDETTAVSYTHLKGHGRSDKQSKRDAGNVPEEDNPVRG